MNSQALYQTSKEYGPMVADIDYLDQQPKPIGLIGQIFPMSNLIEIRTGLKSYGIFNTTIALTAGQEFLKAQCQFLVNSKVEVIFYSGDQSILDSFSRCTEFGSQIQFVKQISG
jgi:hypothetical protein